LQWDSPLWLSVDALRLRQVLINLLCNAIKFTEAGEVKVVAGFEIDPEDSARGLLHLSIIDTGIGISWRDQRRLFQAFTQADDSITRKFGGTGLGLTICRRLLGLMGGTIVLHSELGKGTTFVVRVPALLAEPQVHLQQTNSSASTAAAGSGMPALKVLVVEDHPQNQFVIRRQLQTMGHENVQALTGQAGLDCFAGERFDVVLL
ncbi:sensor protein evgS, partial [Pseudomonas fragi]|nr:sensor protein evgS [Pseudomonas sp. GC01]